jgi:flagellar biosynthetic protein FliQ
MGLPDVSAVSAALELGLVLIAVPVLAITVTGLLASLLQAVTQLQDSSLAFVPKLMVAAVTLWLVGPWMLSLLSQFTTTLWVHAGVGG